MNGKIPLNLPLRKGEANVNKRLKAKSQKWVTLVATFFIYPKKGD